MNIKLLSCSLLMSCSWLLYGESSQEISSKEVCAKFDKCTDASRFSAKNENKPAFARRVAAACLRTLQRKPYDITAENNGDQKRVPFFAANFTKGLEHDPATGLLTKSGQRNYKKLLRALSNGKQRAFNAIDLFPGSLLFVNPQSSFSFSLDGSDSASFRMELFPELSSPEAAALMLEMYLAALCRDVEFNEYGTGNGTDSNGKGGSLTNDAAAVLQDLGLAYRGPRNKFGVVDASVLFRTNVQGDLVGPYISQFLLLPLKTDIRSILPPNLGLDNLNQEPFVLQNQVQPIAAANKDFVVSFSDFVAVQNGQVPVPYSSTDFDASAKRYIINGRDMASYVHFDISYQEYYNALNILLANLFPFSPFNPYFNGSIKNEFGLISLGAYQVITLIAGGALEAVKNSFAHKWRAQRVARPEAFAGLVQYVLATGTNPFNLNPSLFVPHAGIDVLALTKEHNQQQGAATYLLSQAFPEGCPLHPSYPSGHATIAGGCVTVLKAFLDNDALIKDFITPVKPNPLNPAELIPLVNEGEDEMTVAGELNKLASNMSGRMFAGVHYRADIQEGMQLGEQVALKYLQDQAVTLTEQGFKGFVLTKFDGTRVRVTANCITPF